MGIRRTLVRTGKFFLYLFLFVVVVGGGAIAGLVISLEDSLPIINYNSYRPSLATKIYDLHGNIIATLHAEENRVQLVPLSEIPRHLQHAVISTEDERFYKHFGVDFEGIARAAWHNWKKKRIAEGASTITQQLARNAFLTPEVSVERKLKEMLLALRIERKYTKDEILEAYLNEIYFGHGTHGVASAAHYYFGKSAIELNTAECALLAGLIRSPQRLSPYVNKNKAKYNQLRVLRKMKSLAYITAVQEEKARQTTIILRGRHKSRWKAPYFVEEVRKHLLEKFGVQQVYSGGLKVYTTLDLRLQKSAEEAVMQSDFLLERPQSRYPKLNGALVAIDPRNGYILSMVGGRDFESSKFNRATQAKRQPGSAFKPFVYATAIDYGTPPNQIINDEEVSYVNRWTKQVYSPKNYDEVFHGPTILRVALQHSYNVVAVKLIDQIGIDRVIEYARKMGIKSKLGMNLSLALGTSEISPIELLTAYCVFANQGIKASPTMIRSIEDPEGNVLEENRIRLDDVLCAGTAYVLTDMLQGVMKRGTGRRADIGRPCAGKTGTTSAYGDAWFVGYTPSLAAAVWVGCDDNSSLGEKKSGGVVAGPIWKTFMKLALRGVPEEDFHCPSTVEKVEICTESGLLATSYCKARILQAFLQGTEPDITCNLHQPMEMSPLEPGFEFNPESSDTSLSAPQAPSPDQAENQDNRINEIRSRISRRESNRFTGSGDDIPPGNTDKTPVKPESDRTSPLDNFYRSSVDD